MNGDFIDALRAIEKEKEIPFEVLIETIESALVTAYKKNFAATGDIRVRVEYSKGGFKVFCEKTVVDQVTNPHSEISLAEAHSLDPTFKIGDVIEVEVTPRDFGRIAAQTAKQVVVQRIREAERDKIFEEFSERIGEVMTGTVQRHEQKNVFISLGKVEALLPPNEQVPTEPYKFNDRIKVYILDVRRTPKGPQVIVSRTHPNLIRRLFELEVPEIHDGVVTIKSVAREPGARSKIAVASNDEKVDPVGACVGHRGSRVQAIVNELYDEKIDIVRWDENPARFIAESLSPAKVVSVKIDEETTSAFVIVPDNQLSLAIGKAGQNVRLAARLTGWRIDIRSESQVAKAALTTEISEEIEAAGEETLEEMEVPAEHITIEEAGEEPTAEVSEIIEEEAPSKELEEPSEEAIEAVAEAVVYQAEAEETSYSQDQGTEAGDAEPS
ncbi:MAG: transcription termination factor NusA, partial [Armatimonadota bacterium]|nr:transcription termination factor NusA [Armatimonadota bacterium]